MSSGVDNFLGNFVDIKLTYLTTEAGERRKKQYTGI
jgi:hypothetical protein